MGRQYQRVKRGMVFWYNIDQSVDKTSNPTITVRGKTYKDHIQYGKRMFLVVSNDSNNAFSPLCNIVPLSAQEEKADIPVHVYFKYMDKNLMIMCESVHTINSIALTDYCFTLSDSVMNEVDKALAIQMGINISPKYLDGVEASLGKIEEIIGRIIQDKVEQYSPKQASAVDIEDAVLRLGEGLENLFGNVIANDRESSKSLENVTSSEKHDSFNKSLCNSSEDDLKSDNVDSIHSKKLVKKDTKPESQVDKFYRKYPSLSPEVKRPLEKKSNSKNSRRSWTEESMREFIKDTENMPPTEVANKWGFDTVKKMFQMKYYVKNKLDGLAK